MATRPTRRAADEGTEAILRHWREAVPNDRLAHLVKDATRGLLRAMEKLGYITRRRMRDNRKNVYVFLTPEGKALRRKLVPLAEEANERAVQGVPAADIATTRKTLLVMIENLARDELQAGNKKRRMPSTREL